MTISAAQVKELRDLTGAGMMDCKAALNETNGDMEAAVDWLRKKGISKADKKAGRTAAEGLIGVDAGVREAAVVEVNSETDFVARNAAFQEIVANVAKVALAYGATEAVAAAKYPGSDKSVTDTIKDAVGTIGENMGFRRSAKLTVPHGVVATYVHNAVADGLGKLGLAGFNVDAVGPHAPGNAGVALDDDSRTGRLRRRHDLFRQRLEGGVVQPVARQDQRGDVAAGEGGGKALGAGARRGDQHDAAAVGRRCLGHGTAQIRLRLCGAKMVALRHRAKRRA